MTVLPRKIINDPVYGYISIDHPLLLQIVAHPFYQRLRRIHQMAMAQLVYPGAVHTRLHHSLGAYHLMCLALTELRAKGTPISEAEALGAKIAILLHDLGHGPYSHALEGLLAQGIAHESMSLWMMQHLNAEFDGALDTAIAIFTNQYPKPFLHQLVSGQLDVDRMDYLTRDSYFTGVSEGTIGYDRITKMLVVHHNQLMVEEKAIYSIEKFLVARRLMYWQVYLHKTVLAAEQMLKKILTRAREVAAEALPNLQFFLAAQAPAPTPELLLKFAQLDDMDVMMAIKTWQNHPDVVLATLCKALLNRRLYKIKMQSQPFELATIAAQQQRVMQQYGIDAASASYLVFTGTAHNTTYTTQDERINILFKDGSVKDISAVDNALVQHTLSATVDKHYICVMP
ncbi:MAG: HD domain-containing protein [Bacteroidetes bacterium]|nr:MAG: HD domain-containing protein [Bacteroidota bacterium]